jgi:hypothetical protein
MRIHTESVSVQTTGKGTYEITDEVTGALERSGVVSGTLTVFVQHTSCSLIIMENADPTARRDQDRRTQGFLKWMVEQTSCNARLGRESRFGQGLMIRQGMGRSAQTRSLRTRSRT